MKKSILNEINEMKYLFNHQRGVVISEQAKGINNKNVLTEQNTNTSGPYVGQISIDNLASYFRAGTMGKLNKGSFLGAISSSASDSSLINNMLAAAWTFAKQRKARPGAYTLEKLNAAFIKEVKSLINNVDKSNDTWIDKISYSETDTVEKRKGKFGKIENKSVIDAIKIAYSDWSSNDKIKNIIMLLDGSHTGIQREYNFDSFIVDNAGVDNTYKTMLTRVTDLNGNSYWDTGLTQTNIQDFLPRYAEFSYQLETDNEMNILQNVKKGKW